MADDATLPRFGSYAARRFHLGQKLLCEVRGWVTVCGLSAAPVPWPLGARPHCRPEPVVFDWLVGAVRYESEKAVAAAWGVSLATARRWRKALLFRERAAKPPHVRELQRRTRIGDALRGKPRPPHVARILARGRRLIQTAAARQKRSAAHRRRGTRPPAAGAPWSAAEDALLASRPAIEVAVLTHRTLKAVYSRRRQLGLPDGRRARARR